MAFKHKTDKQLLKVSLFAAFETLRAEGKREGAAVDRMAAISTINIHSLEMVAKMVYRPSEAQS